MMRKRNQAKKGLDKNMVQLIRALNSFPGIKTFTSCGGHPNPSACQWPEGTFFVGFNVAWNDDGRLALEFLAWFVNGYLDTKTKGGVRLVPFSAPPYLNCPGECLHFALEGRADPVEIGEELKDTKKKLFGRSVWGCGPKD